jgi:UDP-glucose 4-epimerase
MKTILIFGATGTVGAYAAVELSKNYHVIAVGRRGTDNGFFSDYGTEYFSVDISHKNDFKKLPKSNIDAVIHVAGVMPARMEGYNPHTYIDSEIHGTLNILEYMSSIGAEKIIFSQAGNNNVYGLGRTPVPPDIQKVFPVNTDHSVYTIYKNAAVDVIEHN